MASHLLWEQGIAGSSPVSVIFARLTQRQSVCFTCRMLGVQIPHRVPFCQRTAYAERWSCESRVVSENDVEPIVCWQFLPELSEAGEHPASFFYFVIDKRVH